MTELSSYLSSRKQRRVLQLLKEHAGRCKAIGHTLGKICDDWSQGKAEAAQINKEKIHLEEKSADNIEHEFISEIAKSDLPESKLREDLISFVRMLDSSAGRAKRSATNMMLIVKYPLPEKYAMMIKKGSNVIFKMFEVIEVAVSNINDPKAVSEAAHNVDDLESEMDSLYAALKSGYFEIEEAFQSAAALIILDHAVRDLEACTDLGEDAIELLAELVKRKR